MFLVERRVEKWVETFSFTSLKSAVEWIKTDTKNINGEGRYRLFEELDLNVVYEPVVEVRKKHETKND